MKKLKIGYLVFFVISLVALVVGASFHGYRIHPENVEKYNLGITMGISMIWIFGVFLILGIVLYIIYKKKRAGYEEQHITEK